MLRRLEKNLVPFWDRGKRMFSKMFGVKAIGSPEVVTAFAGGKGCDEASSKTRR